MTTGVPTTTSYHETRETAKKITLIQSTPSLCFETARKITTTTVKKSLKSVEKFEKVWKSLKREEKFEKV